MSKQEKPKTFYAFVDHKTGTIFGYTDETPESYIDCEGNVITSENDLVRAKHNQEKEGEVDWVDPYYFYSQAKRSVTNYFRVYEDKPVNIMIEGVKIKIPTNKNKLIPTPDTIEELNDVAPLQSRGKILAGNSKGEVIFKY